MILRTFTTREEWLVERSKTIGASDLARLLTEAMSPMFLWGRLRGLVEDPFPELLGDTGLALEPVIRKWWLRLRGEELAEWVGSPALVDSTNLLIESEKIRGLHASPDYVLHKMPTFLPAFGAERYLVAQFKTVDRIVANKLDDERPDAYAFAQNQTEQLASDGLAERGEVVYLVGNGYNGERDIRIYEVQPHAETQAAIREAVDYVWGHFQRDEAPKPDGLDDCRRVIAALYPPQKPKREGILPVAWRPKAKRYASLGAEIDRLERQKKAIQQEIEFEMGQRQLDSVSIAPEGSDTEPLRWIRYETPATESRKSSVTCKPV